MTRPRSRRQALFIGLCAGLGIGFSSRACGAGRRAALHGPVCWWVADRGAQRVVGLNERLVPTVVVPARSPRLVRGSPDGGAWFIHGLAPRDVLTRVGPEGQVLFSLPFERLLQLAVGSGIQAGALCLEERADGTRLFAIDDSGGIRSVCFPGRARAMVVRGRKALLVGAGGRGLVVYDLDSSSAPIARQADSHAETLSVAGTPLCPSSLPGGWWALEGGRMRTLVRWTERLRCKWARSADFPAALLSADPVRAGVWAVGGRNVAVRFFSEGGGVHGIHELGLAGPVRALAAGRSGPLLALPGTLLALDGSARVVEQQGGFRGISDLSRVPLPVQSAG